MSNRFDRQIRFFGKQGQEKLSTCSVAIIGVGGLGTHVVQQLALLGVGQFILVDSEELEGTNLNRYVGVRHDDPIPGTVKVDLGERIVHDIDPTVPVKKIHDSLVSEQVFDETAHADYVFGCLDSEGARMVLNELCAAYARPYFDLATDIPPEDPTSYGGRLCVAWDGQGCIVCFGLLDVAEAQADLAGPEARRNREAIYGVKTEMLRRVGPSVVSINGVVASLGVTEFMLAVTGVRAPRSVRTYRGHQGKITAPMEPPTDDCYYCKSIRGEGDSADVHRYIREGVGKFLR